jgi:hypothetical protein
MLLRLLVVIEYKAGERNNMRKIPFPSAAMVVALLALFVALGGTAVAAGVVPIAKRALVADNAKKLNGLTAGQIAAGIQNRIIVKTGLWSVNANSDASVGVRCDPGSRSLSGGYVNTTGAPTPAVVIAQSFPTSQPPGWAFDLFNLSNSLGASGILYVVCLG